MEARCRLNLRLCWKSVPTLFIYPFPYKGTPLSPMLKVFGGSCGYARRRRCGHCGLPAYDVEACGGSAYPLRPCVLHGIPGKL